MCVCVREWIVTFICPTLTNCPAIIYITHQYSLTDHWDRITTQCTTGYIHSPHSSQTCREPLDHPSSRLRACAHCVCSLWHIYWTRSTQHRTINISRNRTYSWLLNYIDLVYITFYTNNINLSLITCSRTVRVLKCRYIQVDLHGDYSLLVWSNICVRGWSLIHQTETSVSSMVGDKLGSRLTNQTPRHINYTWLTELL